MISLALQLLCFVHFRFCCVTAFAFSSGTGRVTERLKTAEQQDKTTADRTAGDQRPVGQQSRDNTPARQRTAKEHDSRTGKQQNSTTAGQEEQISRTGKQQNSTTAGQQESKKVEAKSNRKTRKRRQQDSRTAEQQEKRTVTEQNSRRVKLVWPVSRRLLPEPAFWLALP